MAKNKSKRKSRKKRSTRKPAAPRGPLVAKATPVHVRSRAAFERYLADPAPVVVDFWAPWCGPCKAMGPVFESVARSFEGKVHFLKVDTEQAPEIAEAFGIRSIPTLIVMEGEEVVASQVGLTGEANLTRMVDKVLDRGQEKDGLSTRIKRFFGRRDAAEDEAQAAPGA